MEILPFHGVPAQVLGTLQAVSAVVRLPDRGIQMRKTLSALGLAVFLTLAPAAAATADAPVAAVSQSQVTPAPQPEKAEGGGNAGLWGLLGLAGLLGFMGLRKNNRQHERGDAHTRTTHQPRP
ncbi:WGxxGxxG family protein [Streptosporangium sp. KLBMP 9127]|nr:hypothetical protein [Streptosporangium sp. KLBMP 9127]